MVDIKYGSSAPAEFATGHQHMGRRHIAVFLLGLQTWMGGAHRALGQERCGEVVDPENGFVWIVVCFCVADVDI